MLGKDSETRDCGSDGGAHEVRPPALRALRSNSTSRSVHPATPRPPAGAEAAAGGANPGATPAAGAGLACRDGILRLHRRPGASSRLRTRVSTSAAQNRRSVVSLRDRKDATYTTKTAGIGSRIVLVQCSSCMLLQKTVLLPYRMDETPAVVGKSGGVGIGFPWVCGRLVKNAAQWCPVSLASPGYSFLESHLDSHGKASNSFNDTWAAGDGKATANFLVWLGGCAAWGEREAKCARAAAQMVCGI